VRTAIEARENAADRPILIAGSLSPHRRRGSSRSGAGRRHGARVLSRAGRRPRRGRRRSLRPGDVPSVPPNWTFTDITPAQYLTAAQSWVAAASRSSAAAAGSDQSTSPRSGASCRPGSRTARGDRRSDDLARVVTHRHGANGVRSRRPVPTTRAGGSS
jgi:hypothetical protein